MDDKIYLQDILPLDKLKEDGIVLMVRHSHEQLNELITQNLIEEYQSFQKMPAFKKCKYIISFVAEPGNQAKFIGLFQLFGILEKEHLPKYSESVAPYCSTLNPETDFYMVLKKQKEYCKFENRLIIDWVTPRGWYNTYGDVLNKEIVKILPHNFVDEFPGLMKIKITAPQLQLIVNNRDSHAKWYDALTRLQAVYLILDKKTGNQYIGTTYGENGLWQRWESYAKGDFTGGNTLLENLKSKDSNFSQNFQFSILEVLSKNASQKECIEAESMWKDKLGTRTFGLNKN